MFARILGLGQWLPDHKRYNAEWPPEFRQRRSETDDRTLVEVQVGGSDERVRGIVERYLAQELGDPFLGCECRRVADDAVSASQAEAWAASAALADAGVPADSVDAILSWALVPDRVMPSNACSVAAELGARKAWAATVDSACHSPVSQLTLAASLVESGRARYVLCTHSHLATRTFAMMHPASPCVGDAATAILVGASETPGIRVSHSVTHGEYQAAVIWCRERDPARDTPWWQAGGAQHMSSHAPDAARALIQGTVAIGVQTIRELMERSKLEVAGIDALVSVQPRAWVPLAIAEGLGLRPEVAPQTYVELAHLGGAGAVANLIEARRRGLLHPGANVVMYAQGAGFTRGAVHISW